METSSCANRDGIAGLLCHYLFNDGSAQYVVLDLDDQKSMTVNRQLSFCTETNFHICASCNGLLLFSAVRENVIYYNLFDLFSKQYIVLPQPQIARRSIRTGLAFDGKHYQVIRIFGIKDVGVCIAESSSASADRAIDTLEMEVFSSETGMWRKCFSMIHLPPELPTISANPLFSNGAIHWEFGGHLLIYFVNHSKCMLIKLPNYSEDWSCQSMTYGQCFWESGGHLHYCYSDFRGIDIWILIKEQEHDCYFFHHSHDPVNLRWELTHTIRHDTLMSLNPVMFLHIRQREEFSCWKPCFVSPCTYIENLDTLYLRLPGFIVSYDLRAQTLKELCTYTFPGTNFQCCMIFPVLKGNDKPSSGNGALVSLPIKNAFPKRYESDRP